jgi:hypothetical protein
MEVILKMKKKLSAILVCLALCISALPVSAFAAERDTSFEETLAVSLKEMGLFKGVSDTDFDLNREPTRVEALVMLVRLLDAEELALAGNWEHPFTDVPAWADKYVGYAYERGLTNGTSATTFGEGNASASMYITFVLRALGYSDTNGEDFTWDNPFTLAEEIGIIPNCVDLDNFWRADVVSVSYAALGVTTKGSTTTLGKALFGSLPSSVFYRYYDTNTFREHDEDAYQTLSAYVENTGISMTLDDGSVSYVAQYASGFGGNFTIVYNTAQNFVGAMYSTTDDNVVLYFYPNGTIGSRYAETVNEGELAVYTTIYPEKFLAGEEEDLKRSEISAMLESDRRAVIVQLPSVNFSINETEKMEYIHSADIYTKTALAYLRAYMKDANLAIDLTDFGFANLADITDSPYIT